MYGIVIAVIGGIIVFVITQKIRPSPTSDQFEDFSKEMMKRMERLEIYFGDLENPDNPIVKALFESGYAEIENYKYLSAISYFRKATKEAKSKDIVALYNLIGYSFHRHGLLDSALQNYALSLNLAYNISDTTGMIINLNNMCIIYRYTGKLATSKEYSEKALTLSRATNNSRSMASALTNLGIIYRYYGEIDSALYYMESALGAFRDILDRQGEMQTMGNIGLLYRIKGDFNKALQYFMANVRIAEQMNDKLSEVNARSNIGILHRYTGNYKESIKSLNKALEISVRIGGKYHEAKIRYNIGLVYLDQGNVDLALEHLNSSLRIFEQLESRIEIGVVKKIIQTLKRQQE